MRKSARAQLYEMKTSPKLGMRPGQAVYNKSYEIASEIARNLAGTEVDCFYTDATIDSYISRFCELLEGREK